MGWKDNLTVSDPDRTAYLKKHRIDDAEINLDIAIKNEQQGDYEGARLAYFSFVEAVRQYNELNGGQFADLLIAANKEYEAFVLTRDPEYRKYQKILVAYLSQNPSCIQATIYEKIPELTREQISYCLYFSDKEGKIGRVKKGRSYELTVI